MPGSLTHEQMALYERDGVLFPLRVLAEAHAASLVATLEDVERTFAGRYPVKHLVKTYAMFVMPFVGDVVRSPAVLDAVESILGPDIMLWGAEFFIKEPRSPRFVSWHQDLTYWGLSDVHEVTAWIALTEACPANGCMRMVPGSHSGGIVPHRDTFAPANILSRGQEIAVQVDEARAVNIALRPGEMSLHHGRIFHASHGNTTDGRRIGLVVRYIAPSMRQVVGQRDYALLVRGEDRFGHFIAPPLPTENFPPAAVELCRRMDADTQAYLYAGAARPGRPAEGASEPDHPSGVAG